MVRFPLLSASLANSLLLLSQTQAKSAMALKGIVKLSPAELQQIFPSSTSEQGKGVGTSAAMSQKDRLRAAVRGALGSRPHEEDISVSQFLGRATTTGPGTTKVSSGSPEKVHDDRGNEAATILSGEPEATRNPVDEM